MLKIIHKGSLPFSPQFDKKYSGFYIHGKFIESQILDSQENADQNESRRTQRMDFRAEQNAMNLKSVDLFFVLKIMMENSHV